MKKNILILILVFAISIFNSQNNQSYWTSQHTSLAIDSFESLNNNLNFWLSKASPTKEQMNSIESVKKTYYERLLKINKDLKNKAISKSTSEKYKALAFFNYNENIKKVLNDIQFENFRDNFHYTLKDEKKLRKYLLKHNLISY